MMQPGDFITKAGGLVKQGQEAEGRGTFHEALCYYEQALVIFNTLLQNKRCVYMNKTIANYASDCLARAQEIKEAIDKGLPVGPLSGSTSSSSSTRGASSSSSAMLKDHLMNDEKAMMMQQLSLTRLTPGQYKMTWNDIVGMTSVKRLLDDTIKLPTLLPHLFTGNREALRSLLFYGPPGTGKTLLGKALACLSGVTFYTISSADVISKYVGDSEKYIKYLFEMVKADKPCILFLDEVDALCGKREESGHSTKAVQQFLQQLDGVTTTGSMDGVFVVACTNVPWSLDDAMRRRFEQRIYVGLPSCSDRCALFRYYVSKDTHEVSEAQFGELATLTPHFSPADIKQLCKMAAMMPIKCVAKATHFEMLPEGELRPCNASHPMGIPMTMDSIPDKMSIIAPPTTYTHLLEQLAYTKSTADVAKLEDYEKWTELYGCVYSNEKEDT